MVNRFNLQILFLFSLFLLGIQAQSQIILVDPGHGGEDKGAEKYVKGRDGKLIPILEKDIALALGKLIHEKLQRMGLTSYLTRSIDRFVSLQERADLANKLKADLFLSVHVNSDKGHEAEGFETYYLDNHNDKAVKKVESVENKELAGEDKVVNQILIDLVIERTAPLSKSIAAKIHNELKPKLLIPFKMKDRGVKAGLFYVLALSKRPAIMLEVGFLSNGNDAKLVQELDFQNKLAEAVATGVKNYFLTEKANLKNN